MSRKTKRQNKLSIPVHFASDSRGHNIPIPIREVRPSYFLVDYHPGGNKARERKCFRDLEQAKTYASQKHTERINYGTAIFNLSDKHRRDAITALDILGDRTTLTVAAQLWAKMNPANNAETIVTTAARYIRGMRREGCRRISQKEKIWKYRKFIGFLGADRLTAGLTMDDAKAFCDASKYTGTTRRNYERAFKNLLNFYAGNKKGKVNHDEKLPETWPPATVEKIFKTAAAHHAEAIPCLTVMFFCGLRPHEAFRLSWEAVDLTAKEIHITPEISKVRDARYVSIPENALKWLAAHRGKTGLVSGGIYVFRRLRELIMKKAGLDRWPVDVTRHTFATAHYVLHGDAAKTMKELGHFGSSETFVKHYKSAMSKRESEKFWEIEPREGKIVRLNQATA